MSALIRCSLALAVLSLGLSQMGGCGGGGGSGSSRPAVVYPPTSFALLSPANGSTGATVKPLLRWNRSDNASWFVVEISTAQDFTVGRVEFNSIAETSFALPIELLRQTKYYWRVTAINLPYRSIASGAPWSFTTGNGPGLFDLTSPEEGAVNVATKPSFSWASSAGATSYTLEIGSDRNFQTFLYRQTVTTTNHTVTIPLRGQTAYFWRVLAESSGGITVSNQASRMLTTQAAAVPVSSFELSNPSTGGIAAVYPVTCTWAAAAGASLYWIQVSDSLSFERLLIDARTWTATGVNIYGVLVPGVTYYWRITAYNDTEGRLVENGPWSFSIAPQSPNAFNISSPGNGATNQSLQPALTWTISPGAATYTLELNRTNDFSAPEIRIPDIANTKQTHTLASALAPGIRYYWRVIAVNAYGTRTATNAPFNFTTTVTAPPGTFSLVSPAQKEQDVPVNPTFTWTASSAATTYKLETASDFYFNTPIYFADNLTATSYASPWTFQGGAMIYWRVTAKNSVGTKLAGNGPFRMEIIRGAGTPGRFQLQSPANGALNQPVRPTFSWTASTGANRYMVAVYTDSDCRNNVHMSDTLTTTSYIITEDLPAGTYYWRALASDGVSFRWSDQWPWSFSVGAAPPPPPPQQN